MYRLYFPAKPKLYKTPKYIKHIEQRFEPHGKRPVRTFSADYTILPKLIKFIMLYTLHIKVILMEFKTKMEYMSSKFIVFFIIYRKFEELTRSLLLSCMREFSSCDAYSLCL